MEWFLLAAILGGLFGSKSIGRKYGSAKRSARAKFKTNNPLGDSYWKSRIKPNERFGNFGAALATPRDKKKRSNNRAAADNKRNKNNLDSCKREKEQLEHDRQMLERENQMLKQKLYQASTLFEQIQSLATTYPSHWVSRVRTNAGKGVSVCHV